MKSYLACLPLLLLCLASCNSPTNSPADTIAADQNPTARNASACYAYQTQQDTVLLTYAREGDQVKGTLIYSLSEKDKNTGTIAGQLHGDTLVARYTFQSEGTESVREVAFLKRGDQLVEGYGEVREQDGKMIFKDRGALHYGNGIILSETDCP